MYSPFEHGTAGNYIIQGTEPNQHVTIPVLEQVEPMHNEGATEFLVDQGLYYPTTTNYGYYCTGFESPGEWDDHKRFFGLDGLDAQYTGSQTENLPYVYYTPSNGYAESPYNPYNPYIPGAMVGLDGPVAGTQQCYTNPPYQTTVSSTADFPVVTHSRADTLSTSSQDLLLDTVLSATNIAFRPSLEHNFASTNFFPAPQRPVSNQTHSLTKVSERPRADAGPGRQAVICGSINSSSFPNPASSHHLQGRGASGPVQTLDNISNRKALSHHNQLKVALPFSSGLSDFSSSAHRQAHVNTVQPKFHYGTAMSNVNGSPNALNEQNRGPRTNRSKELLAVKSYTTKVGDGNAHGNIIIYTDHYNKDDFLIDYMDAKFFVIKSYSEDDVHKSVKYNVWSSTPNGNKKLNSAYEDAQRIEAGQSRRCPVFLFFSVNASGQFCGVTEMIGPVDFQKDMDFWQQDKWSGSLPVKWHFIKDVPNTCFRHILLENNENKPVTNSRDTQEIKYNQGLEMLKIFKNHTLKTSLLDDFLYYENRQKFMQEEKARLPIKSYGSQLFVTAVDPPCKHSSEVNQPPMEDGKICRHNKVNLLDKATVTAPELVFSSPCPQNLNNEDENTEVRAKDDIISTLAVDSLSLGPSQNESNRVTTISGASLGAKQVDVLTVGSMPVKVNGFTESSSFLTVGTIPLDLAALQLEKGGISQKGGS